MPMSLSDVEIAIKAIFDASSLVTGGTVPKLESGRVGKIDKTPYAEMEAVSDVRTETTTDSVYYEQSIDLSVYADDKDTAAGYATTVYGLYGDSVNLAVAGNVPSLLDLSCQHQGTHWLQDEDLIWHYTLSYHVRMRRLRS